MCHEKGIPPSPLSQAPHPCFCLLVGYVQLDDPQAPETQHLQNNTLAPPPPLASILSNITSQVRNLTIILSPSLPLGGSIISKPDSLESLRPDSCSSCSHMLTFMISHLHCFSSLLTSPSTTSPDSGSLFTGNGMTLPPCQSMCGLSAPLSDSGMECGLLSCRTRPSPTLQLHLALSTLPTSIANCLLLL